MRDASAAKKPALNRLHIWWARRHLTVSRAAILASILPAYPSRLDPNARPWPDRFLTFYPTFDSYKSWFLRLIGNNGDSVAGKKILDWARARKQTVPNPYTHPRAYTCNPTDDQLEELHDLLAWFWKDRDVSFCDPMSGGGSIPFEELRYRLRVHSNELNSVASIVLRQDVEESTFKLVGVSAHRNTSPSR